MINKLSVYRKAKGINQKDFAKMLGIGLGTLSKWENPTFNLKELKVNQLKSICESLNISLRDLIEL